MKVLGGPPVRATEQTTLANKNSIAVYDYVYEDDISFEAIGMFMVEIKMKNKSSVFPSLPSQ